MRVTARGHRAVPHTADVRIEAWAPSRDACLAEAVSALVASFADTSAARPDRVVTTSVRAETDPDLLVAVLDEAIYVLETRDGLPCAVELAPEPGGLTVRWHLAPVREVELVGAVPKAVTLHELRFERTDGGWECGVTIDV
nr:putative archease [uncultured bacterium]